MLPSRLRSLWNPGYALRRAIIRYCCRLPTGWIWASTPICWTLVTPASTGISASRDIRRLFAEIIEKAINLRLIGHLPGAPHQTHVRRMHLQHEMPSISTTGTTWFSGFLSEPCLQTWPVVFHDLMSIHLRYIVTFAVYDVHVHVRPRSWTGHSVCPMFHPVILLATQSIHICIRFLFFITCTIIGSFFLTNLVRDHLSLRVSFVR